jgi:hypothetical protein
MLAMRLKDVKTVDIVLWIVIAVVALIAVALVYGGGAAGN